MTIPNFCINFLNKAAKLLPILYDFAVASLADAWIKIALISGSEYESKMSHPSWMRGLKLERGETEMRKTRSHPSRMRGLKPLHM